MSQPDVWTMFWLGAAMSIPTGIAASLLAPRTIGIARAALSSAVAFRTALVCYEVDDAYRTVALPGSATLAGLLSATLAIILFSTAMIGTLQLDFDKLSHAAPSVILAAKVMSIGAAVLAMGQLIRLYRAVSASLYPVERIRRRFQKAAALGLDLESTLTKWGYRFTDETDGLRWMGLTGYQKYVPITPVSPREGVAPAQKSAGRPDGSESLTK